MANAPWSQEPMLSRNCWGVHESTVGRYGRRRVRLTVLPPDVTSRDLRRWRFLRTWSVTGLLLGVVLAAVSWPDFGRADALGLAAVVWLVPLLWTRLAARDVFSRVHTGWVDGSVDDQNGRAERMEDFAAVIETAFDEYRQGRISESMLRAYWASIYQALPSLNGQRRRASARLRR